MEFNAARVKDLLTQFDFAALFVEELGWDRHNATLTVEIAGGQYYLTAVAEKRGAVAWLYRSPQGARLPDRPLREKIDRQVGRSTFEHLIVFVDEARDAQVWSWPKRNEPGKPVRLIDHFWRAESQNTAFIQKLRGISFALSEENELTLPMVTARLQGTLNAERVTRRFYDQFKQEHKVFLDFIGGITELADREWYASLMLNRLMFIYFMQRKGFMNGEHDYLRARLEACKAKQGGDKFYSFYRYFLRRLFHEGLGGKDRNPELEQLIGRIPYLNGGLFEMHPIEERCPDISIPDTAFEAIFDYFDRYTWHLDERPLRNDEEINPDVLGYIFEKYVNQKQMGAYYTKEDITEYISMNTVIPFLFDAAKAKCKVAFENPNGPTIWDHLRDDPDRYIHAAVKHGAESPLPAEIAAGVDDVSARANWNCTAPAEFALSTEIWREVVARRTRYAQIRAKLAAGEVRDINNLITLNLDIRRFAQDVIERCEGPDLLRAFWEAIQAVTILDPTCGSGAFLFAALNILEPLYETCLERMEAFVADLERSGAAHHPKKFEDFKAILLKVSAHPNARYFILKSIILNNLFGVDIMEEAVEICKLRLFLKLAAQVDPDPNHANLGIEPLPDIDFNIRAGNTLIGYATYDDVKVAMASKLDLDDNVGRITRAAAELQQAADNFRTRQTAGDGSVPTDSKAMLRQRLKELADELNGRLAADFGVKRSNASAFGKWVRSHQPFHWLIEFHGIMSNGGFDVIIGNPPWVEYAKIRDQYSIGNGYQTLTCNNLWSFVVERCRSVAGDNGRLGLIVPMSLVCTKRMVPVQRLTFAIGETWFANFESDSNPGQLFEGVKQNVTILMSHTSTSKIIHTSRLFRFFSEFRNHVFPTVQFVDLDDTKNIAGYGIPKLGDVMERSIIAKLAVEPQLSTLAHVANYKTILVHRIAHYYIKCFDFIPYFWSERDGKKKSEDYKEYRVPAPASMFVAAINSTLFYLYWQVYFDAFKAGKHCVESFPIGGSYSENEQRRLAEAGSRLSASLRSNSKRLRARYQATGAVEYDQFFPRRSKPIIDEIDRMLASHFALSADETDYVLNYDIKFRVAEGDVDDGE